MREAWIREIEREYERQRAENFAELDRRLREASAVDSQIGALVDERMGLFQRGAREALSKPDEAMGISARLVARIEDIQFELRGRLQRAGFDPAYLQPIYACARCQDTGYVGDLVRERCDCFEQRLRARATATAGLGLSSAETFEAYDEGVYSAEPLEAGREETQRTYMERVRSFCEEFADGFPATAKRNVLLFGASGLGKTYMLNSIGNRVKAHGGEVIKLTAYQLGERIRASVFDRDTDSFSLLLEAPLLLLDDLGVEPLYNNLTIEHLFTLLNERLLADLHTIVSTNLQLDELRARYTERVCSRMFDRRVTTLIQFKGRDVRLW